MNYFFTPEQPTSSYHQLDSGDYELVVRQHPREALVTQPGKEKNRKPIDPPPIVQLKVPEIKDPIRQFLQSPYLFMMCHLEPGENSSISEQEAKEALTGSISSSLHRLKDIDNQDGGFFVFGDISVKIPGTHRLRFTLMELQKDEGRVVSLRSTLSEPFNVVPQKHWRGLEESTYLSRAFSDQGVRLRLRKENRTTSQKRNYTAYQDPQPGPSSVAGEQQAGSAYGASPASSHYGFEAVPKRQRSDDYSQQGSMYGTGERAMSGYTPREFGSSMSSLPGYPVNAAPPRQSPQSSFGFQQPIGGSTMPTYYGQGQIPPSLRGMDSSSRQSHVSTPGSSYSFPAGSINTDGSEYFSRRPADIYNSMPQATATMTPVTSNPENFSVPGQAMYTPGGPPAGGSTTSLYQHTNIPSPMGGPATTGSSTSAHTPGSARGSAVLNPSAQSFNLPSHSLHQLSTQGYPDPQQYQYSQQQYAQQQQQQPHQSFQHSPPSTMPHLNQPLTSPHQQAPSDPDDPYGQQQWQPHYGA